VQLRFKTTITKGRGDSGINEWREKKENEGGN
jgi:hypothetical protein